MRFVILNIVGLVVFGMSAYYTMKNLKRKAWDIAMLSFGMCLVLAPVNVLALVAAACDWTGTRLPLPIESFFRYIFDMDLSRSSAHFGLVIPERMQVVSVSSFVLTVLLSKKDVNDLLTGKVYFDISSEGLENMPDDMKDTYEYKIMEQVPRFEGIKHKADNELAIMEHAGVPPSNPKYQRALKLYAQSYDRLMAIDLALNHINFKKHDKQDILEMFYNGGSCSSARRVLPYTDVAWRLEHRSWLISAIGVLLTLVLSVLLPFAIMFATRLEGIGLLFPALAIIPGGLAVYLGIFLSVGGFLSIWSGELYARKTRAKYDKLSNYERILGRINGEEEMDYGTIRTVAVSVGAGILGSLAGASIQKDFKNTQFSKMFD